MPESIGLALVLLAAFLLNLIHEFFVALTHACELCLVVVHGRPVALLGTAFLLALPWAPWNSFKPP